MVDINCVTETGRAEKLKRRGLTNTICSYGPIRDFVFKSDEDAPNWTGTDDIDE